MSQLWSHIRPAQKVPCVTTAQLSEDGRTLRLEWDDGQRTAIESRTLRQLCPCATCVDEWTHQRTFRPEEIPADLRAEQLREVGNYALSFTFSDGHQTGIFHWTFLRRVCGEHPAR